MQRERSAWNKTFFDRVIQTNIGQALKAQYDHQPEGRPLPRRLAALLEKIDEAGPKKDNSIGGFKNHLLPQGLLALLS
jgi:hypothetical protein